MNSKETDVSEFWCWNEECPDYGKKEQENIVSKEQYGKDESHLSKFSCKFYPENNEH